MLRVSYMGACRDMVGLSGVRPAYAEAFRCIGPACEDSCCVGWSVYFDEATWEKYRQLPPGQLRALIDASVVPLDADARTPGWFARVAMDADKRCPFLNTQQLCQIQVEHGAEFLSATCATYPRIRHVIDGVEERSLSLSCPEAARLVLLAPELLGDPSPEADGDEDDESGPMLRHFWAIRGFVLELLTNRQYAIWQRLFLLGLFTRRMDMLARGQLDRRFGAVLCDFRAAVASGALRASMETIPADLPLQLEMVLRLASLQLTRSHVGPRFQDVARAFSQGIGHEAGSTMSGLVARYREAHERYYARFFAERSAMLENLLVNWVFRSLLPFGHKAGRLIAEPEMAHQFALLASQFALFKGLLIGVAGYHGEAFSAEHVVWVVQAASKHFEHHPQFLEEANRALVDGKLDNVRGLTMLVRN